VVSRTLASVGPNATLIEGDFVAAVRRLKAENEGDIDVGGPALAGMLTPLGLIDAYRIYLRPVVLGHGTPFFASPPPRLHLESADRIGDDVIRLIYVPA
jgi:dihydrofolate reductase